MSLVEQIKSQHAALAAAFVIAIALPNHLVFGDVPVAAPLARGSATSVNMREVPALVVARTTPLFTPGRVPPEMAAQLESQAAASASATAAPVVAPPTLPTLVGIVLRGNGAGVALAKGSDGQTQTLRTGEQIDGWTLVALSRAAAVFAQGGTRQSVALDFGSAKAPSAGKATPPGASVAASANASTAFIPLPPPPADTPSAQIRGGGTPLMTSPIPTDPTQDKQ